MTGPWLRCGLDATHGGHTAWTLVDFNDQKRGRFDLIRGLLDRIPDTAIPPRLIDVPLLEGRSKKETYPASALDDDSPE
jgi:hypothetical protein